MSPSISQGWSVKSSSASPWNAGILLDVPTITNQYPPGLSHGAWRTSPAASSSFASSSSDTYIATGSKRPRSPAIQSSRRAPPPPALSRLQPVPVAFPMDDNPFSDRIFTVQDENNFVSSNAIIYRSPNSRSRVRLASVSQSESAGYSYPLRQFQPTEVLAQQRAAADKEARSKVVASILLNRVNLVGKPMRRRPRNVELDGPRTYVRSGLGRCVSAAE